jgi:hypothetical protein
LVANSPGLIAGSNVLHRLLMPRHPPCALHSLPNKHSTKTTTHHQQPTHPVKERANRGGAPSSILQRHTLQKQTPTQNNPQPAEAEPRGQVRAMLASTIQKSRNKRPTSPTLPHPGEPAPDSSGPNSVPKTRTSQTSHQVPRHPNQNWDDSTEARPPSSRAVRR